MCPNVETREEIKRISLLNAITHGGKAQKGPVIGKLLAEQPVLREKIGEITLIIDEVIEEINELSLEKQEKIVKEKWPKSLIKKKVKEKKALPPLPNIESYKHVVTRFSPNPDAPVHLGSARAIILCNEYAKIYKGKFLVRFEDTDPKKKRPKLEFYDAIKDDLKWLKSTPSKYFIQSDRLQIYYSHAERLLEEGNAYICTCDKEIFKKLTLAKKPCPCHNLKPEENIERWKKMHNGSYKEGEAVVRIKTDLSHPNPAVRDWPALRIIDTETYPHPRIGSKYRVWPLYNLACGIDDHIMGITHIIRGKEHLTNQVRQEYMYRYFGWRYPEAIHYGRLKISGASLSKSQMVQDIAIGKYEGWDDPRLATFLALKRRGIQAEAIRKLIIDIGPKTQDVTISWENLYAHNRKLIEPKANRYFFVHKPKELLIQDFPKDITTKISLHPDFPERGNRKFKVKQSGGAARFWISDEDFTNSKVGETIRLIECCNTILKNKSRNLIIGAYQSENYAEAKRVKAKLIHWIPYDTGLSCKVVLKDASVAKGLVEGNCQVEVDEIVQFERFGFVRIDNVKKSLITAYYCHR